MSEEWAPWVEHDHTGVPPHIIGRYIGVESERPNGTIYREKVLTRELAIGFALCWAGGGRKNGRRFGRVLRYRLCRPRALISLIEIIETLPERQKEEA